MNTGFMCYIHNADVIRGTICSLYIDNAWYSDLTSRNIQLEFDIGYISMRYLAFAITSNNYEWEVLHVQDKENNTIASVTIPDKYDGTVKLGVKLYDTPPTVGSILNVGFDYVITGGIDLSTANTSRIVSITCETPNAVIRYTINGSDPTKDSTEYAGEFAVEESCVIKARAYKYYSMVTSDLASKQVTVKLPTPQVSFTINENTVEIDVTNVEDYADFEDVMISCNGQETSLDDLPIVITDVEVGTYEIKAVSENENDSDAVSITVTADIVGYDSNTIGYNDNEIGFNIQGVVNGN